MQLLTRSATASRRPGEDQVQRGFRALFEAFPDYLGALEVDALARTRLVAVDVDCERRFDGGNLPPPPFPAPTR